MDPREQHPLNARCSILARRESFSKVTLRSSVQSAKQRFSRTVIVAGTVMDSRERHPLKAFSEIFVSDERASKVTFLIIAHHTKKPAFRSLTLAGIVADSRERFECTLVRVRTESHSNVT